MRHRDKEVMIILMGEYQKPGTTSIITFTKSISEKLTRKSDKKSQLIKKLLNRTYEEIPCGYTVNDIKVIES